MTDHASVGHGVANGPGGVESSVRLARVAVSAVFFINGAATANWLVRIPAVQARLGLTAGSLGLALLGVAVGALVAMPYAGRMVSRHGSRPVTRVAAVAFASSLMLPALAPNPVVLVLALVALGAGHGALDVAMNAQAATVERRYGRPIMSGFHALFSLGGLAGAGIGGIIASHHIQAAAHLLGTALVAGVLASGAARFMLPASADAAPDLAPPARPHGALVTLGIVAFCVLLGEGAMADWSALYLRDVNGAAPGVAAAGYAAFSLMMAAGRIVGDSVRQRFGAALLVRAGGVIAALGLALALALGSPWGAIMGFAAVGAGMSITFPIVLATAGALPGTAPGTAIATVSTFGYAGFLAGPPLIGFVAQALTLRGGLAVVVVTSLVVAGLAGGVGRATEPAVDGAISPAPSPRQHLEAGTPSAKRGVAVASPR
jgi:MFS family permease